MKKQTLLELDDGCGRRRGRRWSRISHSMADGDTSPPGPIRLDAEGSWPAGQPRELTLAS